VRTFAYGVRMPEQQKTREQYMTSCVGLVLAVAVGALCVVFSLSNGWVQTRVLTSVALYLIVELSQRRPPALDITFR
jgi:high-affinity Fe2+/Pb2+ permease